MKKILILTGAFILSAATFSTGEIKNFQTQMNVLEKEFQTLLQREDQRYAQERTRAASAGKELEAQHELYKKISKSLSELQQMKSSIFYKTEYDTLMAKYQTTLSELDNVMKREQDIIASFNKIEASKNAK